MSLGYSNEFKLYSSCFCAKDDFGRVTTRSKLFNNVVHKNFNSAPIYSRGWSVFEFEFVAVIFRQLEIAQSLTISSNLCVRTILGRKIRPNQVINSYNSINVIIPEDKVDSPTFGLSEDDEIQSL